MMTNNEQQVVGSEAVAKQRMRAGHASGYIRRPGVLPFTESAMFRQFVVLSMLGLFCVLAAAQDKYSTTFDHLDLKALLSDEARLKAAIKCLEEAEDTSCTPAGKFLKGNLAEIVETDCAKCTDAQRDKVGGFFAYVSEHYPEEMKKLLDKYDSNQEYRKKYAESWKESGIKL